MKTCGRFSADDKAFHFLNDDPGRAWENMLWNQDTLCRINQYGKGSSFYKHSGGMRTGLCRGQRQLYILRNGQLIPLLGRPSQSQVTHGAGYTTFKQVDENFDAALTIDVPNGLKGEAWSVSIKAKRSHETISIIACMELDLVGYRCPFENRWSIPAYFSRANNAIFFINNDACCPNNHYNAFASSDRTIVAYETVEDFFPFTEASAQLKDFLPNDRLKNTLYRGGKGIIAALQIDVDCCVNETVETQIVFSIMSDEREIAQAAERFFSQPATSRIALRRKAVETQWSRVMIETPDQDINRLFNIWAKHNMQFTALWTRVYSRGFRDSLQDAIGISAIDPQLCRNIIITAMEHVFQSGRCMRAWDVSGTALGDEFYADGPVWIPLAINSYIKETGDVSILDHKCQWADGGSDSVKEHMLRAIRFLGNDCGEHGLCRIHDGDWCDTAHLLGKQGRGEGVWLTIACCNAAREIAALATFLNDRALQEDMECLYHRLEHAVITHGFEGDRFLIAFNDAGNKVGSRENAEGQIFLNPQSWAVISGLKTGAEAVALLESADKRLDTPIGPLLLSPAYTQKDASIGSLTGFFPGTIENGSCYCHAAAFKIVADAIAGRPDQAYRTLRRIMPGGDADSNYDNADCPPYAFTNCRYALDHPYLGAKHLNQWITGTTAWCWVALTEYIIGVKPGFAGLELHPQLPDGWDTVQVHRHFRGCNYSIRIRRTGSRNIRLDGVEVDGFVIPCVGKAAATVEVET
jgi:cellobiose phosphorylase